MLFAAGCPRGLRSVGFCPSGWDAARCQQRIPRSEWAPHRRLAPWRGGRRVPEPVQRPRPLRRRRRLLVLLGLGLRSRLLAACVAARVRAPLPTARAVPRRAAAPGPHSPDRLAGTCPSGPAWADKASDTDTAHASAECSNRGLCQRSIGTCQCSSGFVGSACQRSSCPFDCSGHGVCENIQRIGKFDGVDDDNDGYGPTYTNWDASMTFMCRWCAAAPAVAAASRP